MVRDQTQKGQCDEALVTVRDNENVGDPSAVGPHEVEESVERQVGLEGGECDRRVRRGNWDSGGS